MTTKMLALGLLLVALAPPAMATSVGSNNCNNYGVIVQVGVSPSYSCTYAVQHCDHASGAGAGAGTGGAGNSAGAQASAGTNCSNNTKGCDDRASLDGATLPDPDTTQLPTGTALPEADDAPDVAGECERLESLVTA